MSDEPKPNKGELIPSINHSLARKESSFVKRGLDLIQEQKKQQVRVQIGDSGFGFDLAKSLSHFIKTAFKDKYDLKYGFSYYAQELLELAENDKIDIFVLIVNNILFSSVDDSIVDRLIEASLLIFQIKSEYGKRVIALSSLGYDFPHQISEVKTAADFYFELPLASGTSDVNDFLEAFEKCVKMLHDSDEVPRKNL